MIQQSHAEITSFAQKIQGQSKRHYWFVVVLIFRREQRNALGNSVTVELLVVYLNQSSRPRFLLRLVLQQDNLQQHHMFGKQFWLLLHALSCRQKIRHWDQRKAWDPSCGKPLDFSNSSNLSNVNMPSLAAAATKSSSDSERSKYP
ncbi:hypothetical protein UFOVP1296_62 [uncultured Caudovirales phage]|uniref:Uncharacterized protein n=1 Tax=uncultured Caudovirales phage TaxID=2100421 RepID=A0A6J5RPH4_9CAUD|nr:hypothetical protein UFOVP471_32 [uncultured Caudovirales phage]CAB4169591.1 hypothetical protein UFOVP890_62 [uncultured Caudovirales phage]CAB4196186.1 hypothetical protein UFOVP1296_62 [uncultured Caudovirales phage]